MNSPPNISQAPPADQVSTTPQQQQQQEQQQQQQQQPQLQPQQSQPLFPQPQQQQPIQPQQIQPTQPFTIAAHATLGSQAMVQPITSVSNTAGPTSLVIMPQHTTTVTSSNVTTTAVNALTSVSLAASNQTRPAQPDSIELLISPTQEISQTTSQTEMIESVSREPSPPLPFCLVEESLPSPSQEQLHTDSDAEAHEYVVEEILDKKVDATGEVKLLVKWENYPSSHNTWEPLDNLQYCDEALQKYEIKRAQRLAKLYGGLNSCGEGSSRMGGYSADKKDKKHQEYKVSEVIGLTEVKNQKYFLVNLQDDGGSAYIRSSLANKLFPCKVIDFYLKHITWKKPT